jgi:hypothetical protein
MAGVLQSKMDRAQSPYGRDPGSDIVVNPQLRECRLFALRLANAALQTSNPDKVETLLYLADRWSAGADEMECMLSISDSQRGPWHAPRMVG